MPVPDNTNDAMSCQTEIARQIVGAARIIAWPSTITNQHCAKEAS